MENKNDKSTKLSIILTDIFLMIPFFLLAVFGFLAIVFVGGLGAVASFIYLIKSFTLPSPSHVVGGLTISLIVLASAALLAYIDYLIFNKVYKGTKKYLIERKQAMEKLKNNN